MPSDIDRRIERLEDQTWPADDWRPPLACELEIDPAWGDDEVEFFLAAKYPGQYPPKPGRPGEITCVVVLLPMADDAV